MKQHKNKYFRIAILVMFGAGLITTLILNHRVYADPPPPPPPTTINFSNEPKPLFGCGSNDTVTAGGKQGFQATSIDIGCQGDACVITSGPNAGGYNEFGASGSFSCKDYHNPISDAVFAIIRFLSAGAGIVIIASMVVAGIQYTMAHDDPQAVARAKDRIKNNVIALLIFIFAYAILNFLIPGGFFS
jgi:hypothetical protein